MTALEAARGILGVFGLSVAVYLIVFIPDHLPRLINFLRRRKATKMSFGPILDIVMLVHDQAAWADLAIRAVEHQTRNPYRLIIVDMASVEQKTKDILQGAADRGHTVIRAPVNKSFSNGCNLGASVGDAKFICFLNDDAIVTEGWDGALLQTASVKQNGLVGSASNYASGAQMDPGFIGEPPYLVFVCVALRREVWNHVGPMDEVTFDGFSSEDIDYAWRVKKAGYKLAVARESYVLHAGSRTLSQTIGVHNNGVATTEARARNDAKYNARLIDKHGKDWVAAHMSTRKKLLVVSYHAEEWTRVTFMDCFHKLRITGYTFDFMRIQRLPITAARNAAADYALDNGFDYIVQFDDDATFPPNTLERLISHQKDIVCALAYQRKPPHLTCAFEQGDDGLMGAPLEGIEHTGLRRVDVSGFHCSAIHTSVFKKMRDGVKDSAGKVVVPGTRHYYGWFADPEKPKVGEDFAFCINAKKVGVQVYCDTELISGHIGSAIVVDEAYKKSFVAQGGR